MGSTVIVKFQISAGAQNLVCPMPDLVLHFCQVVGLSLVCGEEGTEIFAEPTMLSSQAHQELQDPGVGLVQHLPWLRTVSAPMLLVLFSKLALPPS